LHKMVEVVNFLHVAFVDSGSPDVVQNEEWALRYLFGRSDFAVGVGYALP